MHGSSIAAGDCMSFNIQLIRCLVLPATRKMCVCMGLLAFSVVTLGVLLTCNVIENFL